MNERNRHVPAIVLPSSRAPGDVMAAHRDHAVSCITGPVDGDESRTAVRTLEDDWLTVARLPSE